MTHKSNEYDMDYYVPLCDIHVSQCKALNPSPLTCSITGSLYFKFVNSVASNAVQNLEISAYLCYIRKCNYIF
jgi:hypothetical protein